MAFKAKLKVANREYNVLKCHYGLFQETDATGRPSSVTRGGMISFIVESMPKPQFAAIRVNSGGPSLKANGITLQKLFSPEIM